MKFLTGRVNVFKVKRILLFFKRKFTSLKNLKQLVAKFLFFFNVMLEVEEIKPENEEIFL